MLCRGALALLWILFVVVASLTIVGCKTSGGEICADAAPDSGEVDEEPPLPPVQIVDGIGNVVINNVLFGFDSVKLQPEAKMEIDKLVREIKRFLTDTVVVVGHTDDSGDARYNLELSRRRAEAVRDYMISQGIAAERLGVEGRGETQPLNDNSSDALRALNRRVEFQITVVNE